MAISIVLIVYTHLYLFYVGYVFEYVIYKGYVIVGLRSPPPAASARAPTASCAE